MARKHRTDEELMAISEHLLYEIQMLFGTVQALATFDQSSRNDLKNGATYNALLEAFAMHTRILLHFLYSTRPYEDDVIAEDFFDDGNSWVQHRPRKSKILNAVNHKVNKRVAHLTYARLAVNSEEKSWDYLKVADEISEVIREFLRLVPPSRINKSFREFISQTVDAEEIRSTLSFHIPFSEPGGASLKLDPSTESLLTYAYQLSPSKRLLLTSEARRLAEEET